ncbi:uncharacterized protein BT62DRAFT_637183 [Guyanagaster necrorhizus]|uniref:Uncharacterized protein n=1 Tax=Guyanagaster necrorhizus TaxID=856835 RepID=A0A9P8ALV7_9AGAR|nr:uncharacterized protein BT62DRAFT_637183 [Guyanagaster necrorhizus MCA 3950]KAG7440210.1 hypothetical protein BT62DRAFT_637183 [Guyanagaster necrorhizus MCA 3950]
MESDSSSCLRYHPPPVYLIYCSEEFLGYEYGCRATYHVRRCCDVPPHGAVLTLASVMEHICRLALPAIDEPHPHRTSPVSQYEQDLTRAGSQKSQIHVCTCSTSSERCLSYISFSCLLLQKCSSRLDLT